jgi:hypothetical protein
MLYFTAALVPEMVTEVTVALADVDRLDPACALMTDAKCWPFCSSEILVAADVLPLKNASQLALIAAIAAAPEVGSGAIEDAGADVAGDDGADEVAPGADEVAPEDGVLLLELHAVSPIAAASARPNAR